MSRISVALAAAFAADPVRMCALAKLEFDSGTVRLWTGVGDLTYAAELYIGAGGLLSIDLPSEAVEIRSTGGTLELAGLDPSILALADTENYQGRRATVLAGAFDSAGALIVDPDTAYRGTIDTMETTEDGETATIVVALESRVAAFERPIERRYTPEDQALTYTGDKGFDYVAALQNKDIVWGP